MNIYDVDGVLLNWYHNALKCLGIRTSQAYYFPQQWDMDFIWDNWDLIKDNEVFWKELPPLVDPVRFVNAPDMYLTSIPEQYIDVRKDNLYKLGFPVAPVVACENKFEFCMELEESILFDDRPATVQRFLDEGQRHRVCQMIPFYARWAPLKGARYMSAR